MKPRRFVEIGKPRIDDRYNVWVLEGGEWFILLMSLQSAAPVQTQTPVASVLRKKGLALSADEIMETVVNIAASANESVRIGQPPLETPLET
jgi:hypothetical protein